MLSKRPVEDNLGTHQKRQEEMKKIFPFYKGENISNNPLGYTNATNARKRMNDEEVRKDFEKTLPSEYWFDYYYTCELENPWSEDIKPENRKYRVHTLGCLFRINIYIDGYTSKKVMFRELPDNAQELFKKELSFRNDYYVTRDYDPETANSYKEVLYGLLRAGYYPHLWKDETDYKKRYAKFVKENVEFRELDVDVVIKEA